MGTSSYITRGQPASTQLQLRQRVLLHVALPLLREVSTYSIQLIDMEGRVIAITGAAGGIGLATAKLLASRGAKLSLADISQEQLDIAVIQIKEAVPNVSEIITSKCDVRDLSQVEAWIKQTVDKLGKLDGACNLAGTVGPKPCQYSMDEEDEEIWDFIIGVNLTVSCGVLR